MLSLLLLLTTISLVKNNALDYTEKDWAATCLTGTRQTPIDLNQQISYSKSQTYIVLESANYTKLVNTPLIVRNEKTFALDASGLGTLMITKNGLKYKYNLIDIHLHWKSEHRFDGLQYDFEVHLVHEKDESFMSYLTYPDPDKDNNLLVVGILFDSRKNQADQLVGLMNIKNKTPVTLDAAQFYSVNEGFYHYLGSLTTPGCSESVNWVVLQNPRGTTADQAKDVENWVKTIYHDSGNARSVKPLGGRTVYKVEARTITPIGDSYISLPRMIILAVAIVLFA
jgi:carbonic anhydrase